MIVIMAVLLAALTTSMTIEQVINPSDEDRADLMAYIAAGGAAVFWTLVLICLIQYSVV